MPRPRSGGGTPAARSLLVCLNGTRSAADGAVVPLTPDALAGSAAAAVAAGATGVQVHPRTPCGRGSLSPRVLGPVLAAVRARVRVPVGVCAGARAEPGPADRLERVASWTVLPDHASVDWHEPGAERLAAALLERGVAVEAGLWSDTDGPDRFARSPLRHRVLRVLAEVGNHDPATAADSARTLLARIGTAHGRPILLHGTEGGTWPVLHLARWLGLETRIGLADTLTLPGGGRARSNAELVEAAVGVSGRVAVG
ncbi:3-keto-5-aminohexanoate cleavage protein [Streptomyces sp. NPDC048290]|uniref:3-keto-5-aminohexanoate cleavage protein n=1 Tax=Streptomyces sp. NPDC048290 TaxID=3155811 RepID=UPI0034444F3C